MWKMPQSRERTYFNCHKNIHPLIIANRRRANIWFKAFKHIFHTCHCCHEILVIIIPWNMSKVSFFSLHIVIVSCQAVAVMINDLGLSWHIVNVSLPLTHSKPAFILARFDFFSFSIWVMCVFFFLLCAESNLFMLSICFYCHFILSPCFCLQFLLIYLCKKILFAFEMR